MLRAPPPSQSPFWAGCSALLAPFSHCTLGLKPRVCANARGGNRTCRSAPFRAGPVEPRLRRCAPRQPPVRLTSRSTRRCKPSPLGSSAPPALCLAVARASVVQPLSICSAVAAGLCPVSRRRPSIPPSFRRSPAPLRRFRAPAGRPSVGQPLAEPKLFGSGKNETVFPR